MTLLSMKQPFRAVVRENAGRPAWRAARCEVATADSDVRSMTSRFKGTEGAFVSFRRASTLEQGFTEVQALVAAVRSALDTASAGLSMCVSKTGTAAMQAYQNSTERIVDRLMKRSS